MDSTRGLYWDFDPGGIVTSIVVPCFFVPKYLISSFEGFTQSADAWTSKVLNIVNSENNPSFIEDTLTFPNAVTSLKPLPKKPLDVVLVFL